ncbi:MAG: glycosyl hydrolase [Bacteroidota bacterium]|nr:glycosyl hydrolase [Bacteroidota bacterium]
MRRLILPSLLSFSLLVVKASFAQDSPPFAPLAWPSISAQTRPWTRWWWMGNAVDTAGLRISMEQYRAAGLGGLELTPIYGVKGYEDHFVDYLSPAWMHLFSFTLGEARRLGMGLDMSTGTGWPFGGGPLIDSTYACKELFFKTWILKGDESLADTVSYIQQPLVHTDGFPKPTIDELIQPIFANTNRQALALFQVRFPQPLPLQTLMAYSDKGDVIDLTSRVNASGRLQWTAPSGSWSLYALFQGAHGKMVERAAPGAEGNVIDHFSSSALKKYLSRFDTAFAGHDLSGLRAFFNDSYEVDDARGQSDWTPGFLDLFLQYRGYDLRQHLPALFGKDSPANNDRVLCDYRETISDLLLDKFTRAWRAWARQKGAVIRDQAHGSPANILDLYAASDIPETEGSEPLRFKFATSAAHVTGKRLASSESVTWLNEHFLSSLGDVKTALDNDLLGGVNHIFYHGTAWSPPGDPWPGWLFYASVHFTPNDPSWREFSTLNQYVARSQSFLQQGSSDNDLLLYYPLYDSWSDRGRELLKHYDRMDPEFNGTGFKACAEWMQTHGYAFDYISDRQVRQTLPAAPQPNTAPRPNAAAIETSGAALYQTLLLPACQYISNEAMASLLRLADSGCTILVLHRLPSGPPGWDGDGHRARVFDNLISALRFVPTIIEGIQRAPVGKGAFVMGDSLPALLTYVNLRQEAIVKDSLQFVRRRYSAGNYYFIVNRSTHPWAGYVQLAAGFLYATIFDPMNGRSGLANSRQSGLGGREVYLQLDPGESVIVVTSRHAMPRDLPQYDYYRATGPATPVNGEWQLEFAEGGPRLPAPAKLTQLQSWTALQGQEVKDFSGTGSYSINFQKPRGNARAWLLDLGKVDVTAQVFMNGTLIATLIGPGYRVTIPAEMLHQQNRLEVRVSNLMANRIAYMDRNGIPWKKFYNTNFPPHRRENRGANGLFDASKWAPLDSGLSGPVTITPLGRP